MQTAGTKPSKGRWYYHTMADAGFGAENIQGGAQGGSSTYEDILLDKGGRRAQLAGAGLLRSIDTQANVTAGDFPEHSRRALTAELLRQLVQWDLTGCRQDAKPTLYLYHSAATAGIPPLGGLAVELLDLGTFRWNFDQLKSKHPSKGSVTYLPSNATPTVAYCAAVKPSLQLPQVGRPAGGWGLHAMHDISYMVNKSSQRAMPFGAF
jgi:hypothetical protein